MATQVEAATVTPPAPPSEHPPPQKFSNDGSFLEQIKRQLAAASRIQTAWRNRADAPTPPGEPVNDLRLALEAHSELKAHEARSATRKPQALVKSSSGGRYRRDFYHNNNAFRANTGKTALHKDANATHPPTTAHSDTRNSSMDVRSFFTWTMTGKKS